MSKKIFVHSCCAACASHVFSELEKAGFKVVAFFYNPEVDETVEYTRRKQGLIKYCLENKIEFVEGEYLPTDFSDLTTPFKDPASMKYISDKERYRRKRCALCNSMVIQETVEQAKKKRLKYFTTTLLCSPYKNHDEIVEISNEEALDYGINFYYQDFRKGYWKGRNYARNHSIELPSYCGCLESQKERRLE
jgi:predicted adenine nucleotide alpha hydrolase (AANH) superfamily ATPase